MSKGIFEKTMGRTLFEKVVKLKIDYGSHCSDLYLPVNEITQKLINDYKYKCNVTSFISQIDGKRWFDIPFAYDEYWRAKK